MGAWTGRFLYPDARYIPRQGMACLHIEVVAYSASNPIWCQRGGLEPPCPFNGTPVFETGAYTYFHHSGKSGARGGSQTLTRFPEPASRAGVSISSTTLAKLVAEVGVEPTKSLPSEGSAFANLTTRPMFLLLKFSV